MLQKSSSSSWMYWISGIAQYCRDEAQGKRAANTITIRACMKATEYLVGTIRTCTCTCMIATEYLVGGTSVAQNTGSEVGYVSCNLLYHHSPAHTHTHTHHRGGVDITPQSTSPVS